MTAAADALALAAAGLPCFPCHPVSKAPLVATGFQAATRDPDRIRNWWRCWPDALAGVPTGAPSGLWVLDLDTDRETGETLGENSFAALLLPWPPYAIRTPLHRGWHIPYRWAENLPGCSTGRLPGVDVRSSGGYIIGWEPGVLIAAKADRSLPFPPPELLAALSNANFSSHLPPSCRPYEPPRNLSRWAAAALSAELQAVRTAAEGHRNDTLNRSSFKIGQIAVAAGLDLEELTAALMHAALMAGLTEREASKTIASGLDDGQQNPRRIPPPRTLAPDHRGNRKGQPWSRASSR